MGTLLLLSWLNNTPVRTDRYKYLIFQMAKIIELLRFAPLLWVGQEIFQNMNDISFIFFELKAPKRRSDSVLLNGDKGNNFPPGTLTRMTRPA